MPSIHTLRLTRYLAVSLVAIGAFTMPVNAQAGPSIIPNATVSNYQLISSERVDRTRFNYTYRATVKNPNAAFGADLTATLTSTSAATTIVQGLLVIGDVPSGSSAQSVGTFVIQQDRTQPFVPTSLVWTVRGNLITGAIPPTDSGQAGASTVAGLDANNNGVRDDVERFILIQFAQPAERAALFQYSKAAQQLILASTQKTAAVVAAASLMRSIECLAAGGYPLSDASQVEGALANTDSRARAYMAANALLGGQYLQGKSATDFSASCN